MTIVDSLNKRLTDACDQVIAFLRGKSSPHQHCIGSPKKGKEPNAQNQAILDLGMACFMQICVCVGGGGGVCVLLHQT